MSTRVTILIPCYQHGHLLAAAVDSALSQSQPHPHSESPSHPDLEIIIIDDGSTDDTRAVADTCVRRHPAVVHYLYQENQGQAVARQRGLDAATGKYTLTLDADDLLEPGAIALALRAFEADPAADAVVGNALIVGPDAREVLRTHTQNVIVPWPEVLKRNPYGVNLGVLARTAALRAAGGLALARPGCEDWDTWARMTRCGMRFVPLDAVMGRYRQAGQSHSRAVLNNLSAYIEMLDCATREDPRLAAAGCPVAPPIAPDVYHMYRNSRVFHALGLALGFGLPLISFTEAERNTGTSSKSLFSRFRACPRLSRPADCSAIAAHLTSGLLFPPWCLEQFTDGLAFALAQSKPSLPQIPLRLFLKQLESRLTALGHTQSIPALRAGILQAHRQTGHRSLLYLAHRLKSFVPFRRT